MPYLTVSNDTKILDYRESPKTEKILKIFKVHTIIYIGNRQCRLATVVLGKSRPETRLYVLY